MLMRACTSEQEGAIGFQDNDSLAKELAKELNADLLVLLTNVDGLMDGPPKDRSSKCAFCRPHLCSASIAIPQLDILHEHNCLDWPKQGIISWGLAARFNCTSVHKRNCSHEIVLRSVTTVRLLHNLRCPQTKSLGLLDLGCHNASDRGYNASDRGTMHRTCAIQCGWLQLIDLITHNRDSSWRGASKGALQSPRVPPTIASALQR